MKFYFFKNLFKPTALIISLISCISLNTESIHSEYLSEELLVESSTKTDKDNSAIPTNPFEIVEMIRRYNSLNDATSPSDALDDALKSFTSLEDKEEIYND